MKRNIFSVKKLATICLCLFAFVGQGFAADVSIKTCAELKAFATCVNNGSRISSMTGYTSTTRCAAASVVLTQDIDCSGTTGMTAIGTSTYSQNYYFHGTFDGDGYSITGFTLNTTNSTYAGLFGYVNGAKIKNVSVDVSITSTGGSSADKIYVGAIVAYLASGNVENCMATGSIDATRPVSGKRADAAGIVGSMAGGTVVDCLSSVSVTGRDDERSNLGGVVGFMDGGTVERCVYEGDNISVKGNQDAGAIVGYVQSKSTIRNCFYNADSINDAQALGDRNGNVTYGDTTNSTQNTEGLISDDVMTLLGSNWDIVDGAPMPNGSKRHTVTVTYAYTDKAETSKITTRKRPGEEYSITTPEVAGYTPDKTVVEGTMGNSDINVTVTYSPSTYTITYNKGANGTGSIKTGTKTYGDAFTLSSDKFTRSGYEQVGWARTDGGEQAFALGGSYTDDADVTLYPVWKQLFTVTFNANGHGTAPESQNVLDGEKATAPSAPSATGYSFNGWNTKDDGTGTTWDFGTNTVTAATTLYAMWTAETYTITYEMDGGINNTNNPATYTVETAVTFQEPNKVGYEFDGWYEESGFTTKVTGITAGSKTGAYTVYAKWGDPIEYSITYNLDGGTNAAVNPAKYTIESETFTIADPTKTGYTFDGWFSDEELETAATTTIAQGSTGDVVLYAKWTVNSYTATFNANGGEFGEGVTTATKQVAYEAAITATDITEPTREGYAFKGWALTSDATAAAENLGTMNSTEGVTLYAVWLVKSFTITLEPNGGTLGTGASPITQEYGSEITPRADPTKTGYTFAGWFENQDLSGTAVTIPATMPAKTYTLYAKWNMDVQATAFTGTYDGEPHGITVTAPAGASVTYSTAADGTYGDAITYTEAGAYTVYYKASQTGYADVKGSSTVTINQASGLTVTLEGATFTYDGTEHVLTKLASTNALTGTSAVQYQFEGDGGTWTSSLNNLKKVAAGTYTVNVRATNPNYSNTATGSATLTINKAAITVKVEGSTLSIKFNGGEWKTSGYTMNSESPLFDRSKVKFSGSTVVARTNAGKTFMGLKPTDFSYDDANITATFDVTDGYLEVLRAEVVVTITGHGVTETYDGTEKTATGYEISASNKGFDKGSVSYDGTSSVTAKNVGTVAMNLDETKFSSTDANFSKVTFEIAADGYVTINKKTAEITWSSAEFTYTGLAQVPTATVTNLVTGDECTVTVTGAGTDAGNYTATATELSNANYVLPESGLTKAFTIGQATIVVETEGAKRAYNGEALTASGSIKSGLVNGETATITLTGAQTDVGTSQNTFTMNWGTAKLANYKISSTLGTLEVIPAAVTVTADDKQKTYGGTDPTLTATVTGTVGEDKVEYTLSRATGENVGEYTITASGAATQGNYSVTFKTGKFTIAPASFTVAGTNYEGAYDGETHGVAATASVTEGTIVSYSTDGGTNWSATVPTITNVGEISVNVKAENANYTTATNTYVLKVTKRAITLVSASARKFYDGTALTANTVTVTEGSYANDESFQYDVTGSQTEVGESDNEFTYRATSSTSSAKVENYEVTLVKGKLTVDPVVTFVMNGHGTQVTAQNVLTGGKATEPTEPSAEGYTFGGWFTDDGTFANAYNFDAAVNANTTLYAKWTINKYTVTFVDEDGETVLASKDYDYGTAVADIETPETPTKAEDNTYTYAFAGWSPELAAVTGVATYKATYTPTYKNYHIAFKTDANVVLFDKEDYHYGDALVAPSNPTREATDEYTYEFDKWEPAVPATVEGSKTYVAKFTPIPNKYTLTWDTDGGTITSAADAYTAAGQVAYGTELVAPAVTKEGFTFAGWTPEVSTMPANNITFKALWTEQLVVSFNVQGHGTAPASQLLDKNEKAVEPTAPMAQNYIFGGWFKDAACTQSWNFDDPVTESMELFAKWTGAFSLTFTLDGVDIETRSAVLEGTEITVLDSATKDGHEFAGWVMETEGVTFDAVTGGRKFVMPAKAVNISGAYKYFVTYKLDNVQSGEVEAYAYGADVTVRDPETRTGYDVTGWTSSVTINDGKFAMPAADVELTATSTVHKHTVTYKITGDYFANERFKVQENIAYGTALTLIGDDMTKEGYTFSGWSGLPETMPDDDVVVTGFYAINSYTVTWKDGEETFSSSSVAYDAKVSAPTTAPTKDGYDFTGWTTSDVTLADDYSFTMPAKAVTLNAKWALVTYKIAYVTNGGNAISSSSYTIESADVTLPAPTRAGYDFAGWFDNEGLTGTAVTKVAAGSFGDKTFYAKWNVINYNITYTGLGDITHENPATYTVEDAIVLTDPSDSTGYNFDGWYIGEDKVTGIAKGSTGAKTIVAKWSPKNVDFKVVYKLYGLTGTVEKTMAEEILQGPADALIIDHISWKNFGDGYSYELVYINGQEHNKSYFTDKIARDGSTIVEVRVEHNEFTFTFYTEGESGWEQWDTQLLYYGYDESENFKVKAPTAPTKTGYTLVGWCADAETCESVQTFPMNVPAKNMNFYPKWTINQYTITFDTKGGSAIDAITQDYNTAVTAPEDPTRAGYLFAGWDKTIPATMPAESITISANWDMDVKATGYTGAYDGNAHGITVTAPEGATVTFSDTENGTYVATLAYADVGEYTVYYKASQEGYTDVKGSATVTITPATMTLVVAGYAGIYDGDAHSGTVTPSVTEGTTVSYSVDNGTTWTTDVPTFTNAGTVDVKVKAENSNYQTVEDNYTIAIAKKVIAVAVSGKNASATYDGTDHLVEGFDATTEETLYDVANVALVDGKLATATTKNVAKVMMGLTEDSFVNNDNNFTVTFAVTDGYSEVTAREVTLSWDPTTFVYDGNSHIPTATAGNVVTGETVTVTVDASGAKTDVGTDYVATATGLSSTNYKLPATVTTTFNITPATITITAIDQWYTYTGLTQQATAAKTDVAGATITYSVDDGTTWSATVPSLTDADTVTVTVKAEKANYATATNTFKFGMAQANINDVTVAIDDWTYGETAKVPTTSATFKAEGEPSITYSVKDANSWSATVPTDAGEYTVKATVAETANYVGGEATQDFTIAKKAAKITVTAASKTYGDVDPTFAGKVEGLVDDADLGTIAYVRVSTDERAGVHQDELTATYTENSNYDVSVVPANFTINKRAVSFTGETATEDYTGSEIELTEVTADGLVDGHTHNVTYSAKGTEVGDYDGEITAVSAVKIMSGADDVTKNYTITTMAGKLTIQATGEFTIALADTTFTYDGTAHYNGYTATSTAKSGTTTFQYQFAGDAEWTADLASLTKTAAGEYIINVKGTNPNYTEAATTTAKLIINRAAVVVVANDNQKVLGMADPTLTAEVDGLVGEDKVTYTLARATGETAGKYVITASGDAIQGNYTVSFTNGVFTISPVVTVVLADSVQLVCTEGATGAENCTEDGKSIDHTYGEETSPLPGAVIVDVTTGAVDTTWHFQGWFENEDGIEPEVTKIDADETDPVVIYPFFEKTIEVVIGDSTTIPVVIDNNDTKDSIEAKVKEAAENSEPPIKPNPETYVKEPYEYTYSGEYECELKEDKYLCEAIFDSTAITYDVVINLPDSIKLDCSNSNGCTVDPKTGDTTITHKYGEETILPTANVVDTKTGKVDSTWEFQGWFDNEDGRGDTIKTIGADVYGDTTIYPFFTKELEVEIADTTITVVIDNNDSKDSVDNKVTDAIRDAGIKDPTKPADSKYSYEFEKYEYDMETGKVTPVFKPTGREYKIVYMMPKAAALSKEIKTYTYGVGTVLPTASIKGDKDWMFMGWYADEGFIGERTKEITKKDIGKKVLYPMFQKDLRYSTRDESGVISVIYDEDVVNAIERTLAGVRPADYDESGVTYTFSKWTEKNGVYTAEYVDKSTTGINHRAIANFHVMVSGRTLEISGAKMGAKIAVFDMSGRMVAQGIVENGTTRVDLAKAGSYVVRVNNQVNRVNVR